MIEITHLFYRTIFLTLSLTSLTYIVLKIGLILEKKILYLEIIKKVRLFLKIAHIRIISYYQIIVFSTIYLLFFLEMVKFSDHLSVSSLIIPSLIVSFIISGLVISVKKGILISIIANISYLVSTLLSFIMYSGLKDNEDVGIFYIAVAATLIWLPHIVITLIEATKFLINKTAKEKRNGKIPKLHSLAVLFALTITIFNVYINFKIATCDSWFCPIERFAGLISAFSIISVPLVKTGIPIETTVIIGTIIAIIISPIYYFIARGIGILIQKTIHKISNNQ